MKIINNKRFKALVFIFFLTILSAVIKFAADNVVLFVYHHPMTNTSVFSYLAPEIKHFNKVLNDAKRNIGNDKYKISYLYKNYYGSGFLKYNPAPNDLDCSVGVYLGEFEYNGSNADWIALNVLSKMSVFYTAFFEAMNNNTSDLLYNSRSPFYAFDVDIKGNNKAIKSFTEALPHIFKGEDYIIMTEKSALDDKNLKVNFPFAMNKNEVLLENIEPVNLYSSSLIYNGSMNKYARQVSVIFDFFVDIKNEKTNEIVRVEIVPEAFLSSKLQLSKRLFVPSVFDGLNSFAYMKNNDLLNNENLYIKSRVYNMMRYIDLIHTNVELTRLPIKMLKRVHQGIDAFSPLLTKNEQEEYYKIIDTYLNDSNVVYLNDIQNIFYILRSFAADKKTLQHYKLNGQISAISAVFDKDLYMLKKSNLFNVNDLNNLVSIEKQVVEKMLAAKTDEDYKALHSFLIEKNTEFYSILEGMYFKVIDINQLVQICDMFEKQFVKAGFEKVTIYWLDKDNIGVIKDDRAKNVVESTLREKAVEAGLPDVNYKFIKYSDINKIKNVRSEVWIRFNPTEEQNKFYENMKKTLLEDRKNYSIKVRPFLAF